MKKLDILWEDSDCIAINKNAGILVHRSKATSTREASLLEEVRRHSKTLVYPVHRLDRGTSGVILFAKHKAAAQQLSAQFQERDVRKIYLAVTRGWLPGKKEVDYPLVSLDSDRFEEARTEFEALAQGEINHPVDRYPTSRYSLVQAMPHSGRRHQIRRHLKHLQHPIIGDVTYGHGIHNRYFREVLHCQRLLLHAWSLSFRSPGGENLNIKAHFDPEFSGILQIFGWAHLLGS